MTTAKADDAYPKLDFTPPLKLAWRQLLGHGAISKDALSRYSPYLKVIMAHIQEAHASDTAFDPCTWMTLEKLKHVTAAVIACAHACQQPCREPESLS
jgi:hypothetical protein